MKIPYYFSDLKHTPPTLLFTETTLSIPCLSYKILYTKPLSMTDTTGQPPASTFLTEARKKWEHVSRRRPATTRFNGKFMTCIKSPEGRPFYFASFCDCVPRAERFFAAVCGNHVTVCELRADGHIDLRQVFADSDDEEQFYTCAWIRNPDADVSAADSTSVASSSTSSSSSSSTSSSSLSPSSSSMTNTTATHAKSQDDSVLLLVAGFRGIIKIIDCKTCTLKGALVGHGNHVNELCVHPKDTNLIFSASRDESLRMWNVKTRVCVAIFAGDQGHRDQVLSVDIHMSGNSLASASMDNCIKIWALDSPAIVSGIRDSYNPPSSTASVPFKTRFAHFPTFSTRKVHTDYVDCARWVGNLLISKSTNNRLILWRPSLGGEKQDVVILREYCMRGAEVCWFVRFGLTRDASQVVCGNSAGKVFVWDIDCDGSLPKQRDTVMTEPENVREMKENSQIMLSHPHCNSTARFTTFSPDGNSIIVCCEDGTMWRWDRESGGGSRSSKSGKRRRRKT